MKALTLLFVLFLSVFSFAQPNPEFSASPLVVCVGQPVQFTDLSTSSSPIISWTWNFGDGNQSTQQNPSHIYSVAGPKNITLTVFDGTTAVPEVKSAYILVNPLPQPSFTIQASSCTLPISPVISNVLPTSGHTYSWNFGNGQTSTSLNPTGIVYNTAGTYNVNLQVTNSNTGCTNSVQHPITVSNFNTNFSASDVVLCVGESVSLTDLSTNANQWNWQFGDGGTSSSQNPQHAYSTAGTYTISLTSQNTAAGCTDNHSIQITVVPNPVVQFSVDPTIGCAPLSVDFTNNTGTAGTYTWNFGNGTTFVGENPGTIVYANNGSYLPSVTFIDQNGCAGQYTLPDSIRVRPVIPDFTSNVVDGCEILEVQFADLSIVPNPSDDPIVDWQWDFGNGTTFSGQNPGTQLFNEGEYDVTLTVTTSNGCQETISYDEFIRVGVHTQIDFTVDPTSGCAKSPYNFTSNIVVPIPYDPDDITYSWSYGDGNTGQGPNPTYNYPIDTGYFDVQLIVSFRGCEDTVTYTDLIYIDAPISLFQPSQTLFCNPTFPVNITTTDMAILGVVSDDVQMIWDWGDGNTPDLLEDPDLEDGDQGAFAHTYNSFGNYTIKQVVHNFTTGCSDSTTQLIVMSNIDASFTLSQDSLCVGNGVNFQNSSTSTNPIVDFVYTFGDGTPALEDQEDGSHLYNQTGTFPLSFTVSDVLGCTDNFVQNIISLARPVANIQVSDQTGCAPINVIYSAQNSTPGSPNGVDLDLFQWTFPNNTTTTTTNENAPTNYLITTEGTFTTSLIVTDEFGCISNPASVSTTITKPIASFSVDNVVCDLENFVATSNSQNAVQHDWILDGVNTGNTSTTPGFSFDEQGSAIITSVNHNLQLIVTDANGCMDTTDQIITVSLPYANPDYDFDGANVNAAGDFICPPVFADLTDNSISFGNISGWAWDFGDGNASTLENPENTYVFAGVYSASLTVTDEYGCVDDTLLFEYLQIGGPTGEVSWQLAGDVCNPLYEFIPENLVNVTNIVWHLDDGTVVEDLDGFFHDYNNQGTYFPVAYLEDDNGCSVPYEMLDLIVPYSQLNAFFQIDDITDLLVSDDVFINDQSTGGFQGIEYWHWDFGESTTTQESGDITYSWNNPGNYTITLIVEDHAGCVDTFSLDVLISIDIEVPNVFTPNGDGINDYFQLPNDALDVYDVVIVNRWGNLIYEGIGQKGPNMWDGRTQGGKMCTEGVYFYRLSGNNKYDGKFMDKHGFVTIEL